MTLLLDPKIFNYVILILYGLNVYWSSAAAITATVTVLYER